MRCVTYCHRVISNGIHATQDKAKGMIVYLGQAEKGTTYRKVCLDHKRAAQQEQDGMIHFALPREIIVTDEKKVVTAQFFVLSDVPRDKTKGGRVILKRLTKKIILRVNTSEAPDPDTGSFKTRRSGSWCPVDPGETEEETGVKILYSASGGTFRHIAHLNIDRLEDRYCDDLIVLSPGRAVMIDPAGADHEDTMVVWNKRGKAVCISHQDWELLQSEEEISAEEAAGVEPEQVCKTELVH